MHYARSGRAPALVLRCGGESPYDGTKRSAKRVRRELASPGFGGRRTEPVAGGREGAHEVVFVVDPHAAVEFGGAEGDHQRNQGVCGRMALACTGSPVPVEQQLLASLGRAVDQRLGEPALEVARRLGAARPELAEVVVGESATDDQHALVA